MEIFTVERLSQPVIEIKLPDGQEIVKVTLNGEDITDKISNGKYTLPPVYEDKRLVIDTKPAQTASDTKPAPSEASTNDKGNSSAASSHPKSTKTGYGITVFPLIPILVIGMLFAVLMSRKKEDRFC